MKGDVNSLWLEKFGRSLDSGNYNEDELQVLRNLAERFKPQEFTSISKEPQKAKEKDPRVHSKLYRRAILALKGPTGIEYNDFCLKPRKLNIVLDLDWTLLHSMKFRGSLEAIEQEVQRLKSFHNLLEIHPVFLDKDYCLLVALRHNYKRFLNSLQRISNLYVLSSAQNQYVNSVVRLIDPENRIFINRVYALGGSESAQKDLRILGLEAENTLILDDQVEAWKNEYQKNIVPSMRFVPFLNEDSELKNPVKAQKALSFCYRKGVPSFRDQELLFREKRGQQLGNLERVFKKVFSDAYVNEYQHSAVEVYQKLRKQTLGSKKVYLSNIGDQVRKQNLECIVEDLGGTLCEIPSAAIDSKKLIQMYFFLK